MMIQSTSTQTTLSAIFNDDEIEVCNILLDLNNIIRKSHFRSQSELLFGWGAKRRRSNRNLNGIVSPVTGHSSSVVSSSPPPIYPHHGGDNEIQVKTEAAAAASPATPLLFSPSESDEKQNLSSRKRAKKKGREELLRSIEELTQSKETLTRNVMNYHSRLKAYNMKLKAKKEEELLRSSHVKEEPNLDLHLTNFGPSSVLNVAQHNQQGPQSIAFDMRTGQSFIWELGQMGHIQSSYELGIEKHHVGPFVIPDLNVPAEQISGVTVGSFTPYNQQRLWAESKARYAQARRNRKIKNMMKIRKASGLRTIAHRR